MVAAAARAATDFGGQGSSPCPPAFFPLLSQFGAVAAALGGGGGGWGGGWSDVESGNENGENVTVEHGSEAVGVASKKRVRNARYGLATPLQP